MMMDLISRQLTVGSLHGSSSLDVFGLRAWSGVSYDDDLEAKDI